MAIAGDKHFTGRFMCLTTSGIQQCQSLCSCPVIPRFEVLKCQVKTGRESWHEFSVLIGTASPTHVPRSMHCLKLSYIKAALAAAQLQFLLLNISAFYGDSASL